MKARILSLVIAYMPLAPVAHADIALDQQLCVASTSGAADQIASLLRQGADANAVCANKTGDDHFGPLYLAVKSDSLQAVAALLNAGAKVDATETKYGLSAVFHIRSPEVGELLFAHGADIHARNKDGEPPFTYLGARIGSTFPEAKAEAVALLLLRHGADINAMEGGETPLMLSVGLGDTDYIAFLLDHHADPSIRDQHGQTALDFALKLEGLVRPEYQHAYSAVEAVLRAHGVTR